MFFCRMILKTILIASNRSETSMPSSVIMAMPFRPESTLLIFGMVDGLLRPPSLRATYLKSRR